MKIRYYALWGAASLSLAHSQDSAPQTWFENLPADNQSILRCYTLRTIPGVRYQVESSQNLVDWHQETALYGLGQDYTVPMHAISSGGATATSGNAITNVSLMVRPSATNSGDLVISWPSLENEAPITQLVPNASAIGWNQLPLFSWPQGTYQFFIRFETSPATPPANAPTLGSEDTAMVAAFQAAIPSINEAIGNSTALSRNTPLASSAATDEKKFWRIRYDWTSDLDRDGTPDWAEFERLAEGNTGSIGDNAYDADSNGDGIKDGQQTDTDGDGTSDADDIALTDITASFEKHAQPLYALFPINNASPDPIYPSPFDINDKGTVLYANGTWSGGTWTPLKGYSNSEVPIISAALINDHGEIIGRRIGTASGPNIPGNVAYWSDPKADYEVTSVNGDYPWISGLSYEYPLQPFVKFSNNGQIIGYQQKEDLLLHMISYSGPYLWTLPGNGRTAGKTPVPVYTGGVLDGLNYWGLEIGDTFSLFSNGSTLTPPQYLRNVTMGPHGELITSFLFDADTEVYLDGEWQTSKTYRNALEVASDGTAIGRKTNSRNAPLLLNGRWIEIDRYAPGAPSAWANSNTELLDISTGGWVLAKRPNGSTNEFGMLLPITVDGVDSSVTPPDREDLSGGVDRTSMAAMGGGGWVSEIWVMAPIGGINTIRFRAPVNSISPLKLTCDTATFSPATLQEKDSQIQVAGTGTTSQDSPVTLKLGDELDSLSIPLRVKTMKRRTVKVALHRVHGLDKNGAETTPRFFPTKENLESYLNKVYGRQTNTFFNVTIFEENGTGVDFDYNDDGKLFLNTPDFTLATPNPKAGTEGFKIDVWVTGGVSVLYFDAATVSDQKVYGLTFSVSGSIVDGDMANPPAPSDAEKPEFLLNTIAHEMGHVITTGLGHPDDRNASTTNIVGYENKGADPNIDKRLMCSGTVSGGKKPTMLIKKEWDRIDQWLKNNVDPQNP